MMNKDYADNCFQFKQSEIKCPNNIKEISKIAAQT